MSPRSAAGFFRALFVAVRFRDLKILATAGLRQSEHDFGAVCSWSSLQPALFKVRCKQRHACIFFGAC